MTESINETVMTFLEQFMRLAESMAQLYQRNDAELFTEMNKAIKGMYAVQHGSEDPLMQALDVECEVIYRNFDMIIALLRTTENGVIDAGAGSGINKFLHNINEAIINIASALGLDGGSAS